MDDFGTNQDLFRRYDIYLDEIRTICKSDPGTLPIMAKCNYYYTLIDLDSLLINRSQNSYSSSRVLLFFMVENNLR